MNIRAIANCIFNEFFTCQKIIELIKICNRNGNDKLVAKTYVHLYIKNVSIKKKITFEKKIVQI